MHSKESEPKQPSKGFGFLLFGMGVHNGLNKERVVTANPLRLPKLATVDNYDTVS